MTLEQLTTSTLQLLRRHIVLDHERSRTGSNYHGENGLDMMGKHYSPGIYVKGLTEIPLEVRDTLDDEDVH